jgi:hypothetical protein
MNDAWHACSRKGTKRHSHDLKSAREHTYLFGPRVSLPTKFAPFGHALIDLLGSRRTQFLKLAPSSLTTPWRFGLGSSTSWSSALGGDCDIVPFVAIRVPQIDSVHTDLANASQNQPRVSAGIVFFFDFGLSLRCPFYRGDASARPKGCNF